MVQSQLPEDEKLTRTVALQRAQSAQETMICSCWHYSFYLFYHNDIYSLFFLSRCLMTS